MALAEKLNLAFKREFTDEHASKTTLVAPARRVGAGHFGASASQRGGTERPPAATPPGAHDGKREDERLDGPPRRRLARRRAYSPSRGDFPRRRRRAKSACLADRHPWSHGKSEFAALSAWRRYGDPQFRLARRVQDSSAADIEPHHLPADSLPVGGARVRSAGDPEPAGTRRQESEFQHPGHGRRLYGTSDLQPPRHRRGEDLHSPSGRAGADAQRRDGGGLFHHVEADRRFRARTLGAWLQVPSGSL